MTLTIAPRHTTTLRTQVGYRVITAAPIDLDQIEGLIRGYVFIWGSPTQMDAYSTWFDRARPPETVTNDGMHTRPIFYEHTFDGRLMTEVIGRIDRVWFDDVGMAYEGHLYRSSRFFPRIVGELLRGELKTSSGSTDTALWYEDGAFYFWPLTELSLTKSPAEKRIPASVLVRSHEGRESPARAGDTPISLEIPLERREVVMNPEMQALYDEMIAAGLTEEEALAKIEELLAAAAAAAAGGDSAPPPPAAEPPASMMSNPNPAASFLSAGRSFLAQRKRENEMSQIRSTLAKLTEVVTQQQALQQKRDEEEAARRNAPPAQSIRRGAGSNRAQITNMVDRNFDHLAASDMWFVNSLLTDNGIDPSEQFTRAMAHKTFDALEADKLKLDLPFRSSMRSTYKRADDFMASNIAGQGQDWTSKWYSTEIWEKARVDVQLLNEMRSRQLVEVEVPEGAKSATVFLEGSDMTWRTTHQANDKDATNNPEVVVNASYVGTGSVEVEPGQLTAAVVYTDILNEDSLIPVAPQLNRQFQASALEVIEAAGLNGDTALAANTNINLIDGTPGTGLNSPYYLVSDGILKLPLVTNTLLGRDASGVLNENTFQATVQKLPRELRGKKPMMLYVMDVDTYEACLVIPALKTKDVADDYTIRTGELRPIFGVKPIQSGQLQLANAAGKVPAAGGTLGRIAVIYCPYWALVWKREVSFENARLALSQSSAIVGSMRLAFRRRSDNAAALSYNVPVTIAA